MNNFRKDEIKSKLKGICTNISRKKIDFNDENIYSENILGNTWGLDPRDLLYLYLDIEKEFNIIISSEHVIKGTFNCFNNILDIIYNELELSEENSIV